MNEHSSKLYDQSLEEMRSRVLKMGGIVEAQLHRALDAFEKFDLELAGQVVASDDSVNKLELELDSMVWHIIARRQPAAGDLRFITSVSKITANLERAGDETKKIARAVNWLKDKGGGVRLNRIPDIRGAGDIAAQMLREALDAFARLDVNLANHVVSQDEAINEHFKATLRQLITFMMEDPKTITAAIDTIWVAKAIERIGDHAKDIAMHVVFIADGRDLRHQSSTVVP